MIFDEREVPLAMPNSLTKEFGSYLSKMQCPILDVEVGVFSKDGQLNIICGCR